LSRGLGLLEREEREKVDRPRSIDERHVAIGSTGELIGETPPHRPRELDSAGMPRRARGAKSKLRLERGRIDSPEEERVRIERALWIRAHLVSLTAASRERDEPLGIGIGRNRLFPKERERPMDRIARWVSERHGGSGRAVVPILDPQSVERGLGARLGLAQPKLDRAPKTRGLALEPAIEIAKGGLALAIDRTERMDEKPRRRCEDREKDDGKKETAHRAQEPSLSSGSGAAVAGGSRSPGASAGGSTARGAFASRRSSAFRASRSASRRSLTSLRCSSARRID